MKKIIDKSKTRENYYTILKSEAIKKERIRPGKNAGERK